MNRRKSPFGTFILLGTGVLSLIAGGSVQAQRVQHFVVLGTPLGAVSLSGYQKISGDWVNQNLHIAGPAAILELTEKDNGARHRLHADDIQVSKGNNGLSVELNGNIRYTLLQRITGNKLIEATATHASYRQIKEKEDAAIILDQVHAGLFRNGNVVADLTVKQMTASQHDGTIVGTGDVRIAAMVGTQRATLTADKVLWDRRTNTLVASGNAQVTYKGQDGKESSVHAEKITFDLTTKKFEVE